MQAFRHEKQEKSREKCTIWMPTKAESKIQYKSTEFGMNVNTLTQPLFNLLSSVNGIDEHDNLASYVLVQSYDTQYGSNQPYVAF